MAKQVIPIEFDVPEGYRFTGRYVDVVMQSPEFERIEQVEPVRETRWLPIYPGYNMPNLGALQKAWNCKLEYAVRVDYENGVPVSVALEPVEGGG